MDGKGEREQGSISRRTRRSRSKSTLSSSTVSLARVQIEVERRKIEAKLMAEKKERDRKRFEEEEQERRRKFEYEQQEEENRVKKELMMASMEQEVYRRMIAEQELGSDEEEECKKDIDGIEKEEDQEKIKRWMDGEGPMIELYNVPGEKQKCESGDQENSHSQQDQENSYVITGQQDSESYGATGLHEESYRQENSYGSTGRRENSYNATNLQENLLGATAQQGAYGATGGCENTVSQAQVSNDELMSLLIEQSAPSLTVENFSGDPLDFRFFRTTFEAEIVAKIKSNSGRINRLIQLTKNTPAHDIVVPYVYVPNGYYLAMDQLKEEYEKDQTLISEYYKRVREFKVVRNGEDIQRFYLWLNKVKYGLSESDFKCELDTCENLRRLSAKLPFRLYQKWVRKDTEMNDYRKQKPKMDDFLEFLRRESKVMNNKTYPSSNVANGGNDTGYGASSTYQPRYNNTGNNQRSYVRSAATSTSTSTTTTHGDKCAYCNKMYHQIDDCWEFRKLELDDRKQFVQRNKLCFACLRPCGGGHFASNCRNRLTCETCKKKHATCLHDPGKDKAGATGGKNSGDQSSTVKSMASSFDRGEVSLTCVLVEVEFGENTCKCYCFLDSLSNGSFVTGELLAKLNVQDAKLHEECVQVRTVGDTTDTKTQSLRDVKVSGLFSNGQLTVKKLYCVESLPLDHEDVLMRKEVQWYRQFRHLSEQIPEYDPSIPFGMILGNDNPRALEPHDFIRGSGDGYSPYAVKYLFGWTLTGPKRHQSDNSKTKIACFVTKTGSCVIPNSKTSDDFQDIKDMFRAMYERDFVDEEKSSLSLEDMKYIETLEKETKFVDGRYQIPLQFRESIDLESIANNRAEALADAIRFRNRVNKGPNEEKSKIVKFMNNMVDKGYSAKVGDDPEFESKNFITYHSVKNEKKPEKTRVVFNCARQFNDVSLNDMIVGGPDLNNKLISVLSKWREYEVAFVADISDMFYQHTVPPAQRAYIRYFWWDKNNVELIGDPVEFEMGVHIFGASSSPSASAYGLKRCADDFGHEFPPETAETLRDNFYVDDCCKSVSTVESGKQLAKNVMELCAKAGYSLRKFAASDAEVLSTIPSENHAEVKLVDRVLGINWSIVNDSIGIEIVFKDRPTTKRGLLSSLCGIYDPLGIIAPFLLEGRRMIQELSASKLGWNDDVDEATLSRWRKWVSSLTNLQNLEVRRCYKPKEFGKVVNSELHVFSDASNIGYGCAAFVRLENANGDVATSLVMGKSRVIPLKGETVARSELVAALQAAELGFALSKEITYDNLRTYYWTDSQIVLSYFHNRDSKFKTFVSNRVRKVLELTDIDDWGFVRTEYNVADHASRGLCADKTSSQHEWFVGPAFIRKPKCEWNTGQYEPVDLSECPEIKKESAGVTVTVNAIGITENESSVNGEVPLETVSKLASALSWEKTVRLVARMIRRADVARMPKPKPGSVDEIEQLEKLKQARKRMLQGELKVDELRRAEIRIIVSVQRDNFASEIKAIKSKRDVNSNSNIVKWNPYIDQDGVLRVGGRLNQMDASLELIHPIILPKFSPVTIAIVRNAHHAVAHSGRNSTINELRNRGFAIVQMNAVVKREIYKCVTCRRLRGTMGEQKMAPLPKERLERAPPFTYCAVDFTGHFLVKNGRKEEKRYLAVFTDLIYRGIHIEMCYSMDTDSMVAAVRRFVSRRGHCRYMRSDNGSNFGGYNNEMKRAMMEVEKGLREYLVKQGCDLEWSFGTPYSSHANGVWERQIGTIRRILEQLLRKHPGVLCDEGLMTLAAEAENIANCRPLSVDTVSDPNEPLPLNPMTILTQKSKIVLPPFGEFDRKDLYRRRWRRVQHLAEEIWERFRKEFLAERQAFAKWTKVRRNFQVGDIVIIQEESMHRNHWPLARVEEVYTNSDNLVRSVKVRVSRNGDLKKEKIRYLHRPITKLVLVHEVESSE